MERYDWWHMTVSNVFPGFLILKYSDLCKGEWWEEKRPVGNSTSFSLCLYTNAAALCWIRRGRRLTMKFTLNLMPSLKCLKNLHSNSQVVMCGANDSITKHTYNWWALYENRKWALNNTETKMPFLKIRKARLEKIVHDYYPLFPIYILWKDLIIICDVFLHVTFHKTWSFLIP